MILRAMAKKITCYQAAEIIGISDRHMRRWRERYEEFGYDGQFDRRRESPDPRLATPQFSENNSAVARVRSEMQHRSFSIPTPDRRSQSRNGSERAYNSGHAVPSGSYRCLDDNASMGWEVFSSGAGFDFAALHRVARRNKIGGDELCRRHCC